MKIFEIHSGKVKEGALVEKYTVSSAGIEIPAILIGEEGRGRQLGVLPVKLLPENEKVWKEEGKTEICFVKLGTTRTGRPKLIEISDDGNREEAVVVFRTMIGFRGGNSHTGDREGFYCRKCGHYFGIELPEELKGQEKCPHCGHEESLFYNWYELRFKPFPGRILVRGIIAQGAAGRMGSGEQIVAIVKKGDIFRTGYSGRLYGKPRAHYYLFTGEEIVAATWDERQLAELF